MEAIRTYLDNVFAAFPQTQQVRALKADMQAGMEEKYHALKAQGKSEHEAVGSVIANFGSMDEITAELGLSREEALPKSGMAITRDEAFEYVHLMKKSGTWIGIGVWLIITGVAGMVAVNHFFAINAVGLFVLLSCIAAAVAMFIINGTRMGHYEKYEEEQIHLDSQTKADLELQSARLMPRYAAKIAGGVAAILLAVGLQALFSDLTLMSVDFVPLTVIGFAPMFLFIVGFAVFLFITASSQHSALENLLGKGEFKHKAKNKKAERIIGTVAAVFWPGATAAFLLWSFVWDAWHISWVIWPVAGVLFAAFAGGIGVWYSAKEEE